MTFDRSRRFIPPEKILVYAPALSYNLPMKKKSSKPGHLHRNCPVCGTDNGGKPQSKYSKDEWVLKECAVCSFVYLENPPPYSELEEDFAWEKTFAKESDRRRRKNPVLYWISSKNKQFKANYLKRNKLQYVVRSLGINGKVLEVGCAGGHHLRALDGRCVPFGIEISKKLAKEASAAVKGRGGKVINASSLEGLAQFEKAAFDCVIMSAYLEHEIQPREVLMEAGRVMKPGGRLIIKVPNFNSVNRVIRDRNWCGF
ncbi:partial demethylmenaquinone methyltransferase / 2-methoxy-6-polyprenyl-1,4-benzoquinol methylase, partial [Anaerolineae bacterium]